MAIECGLSKFWDHLTRLGPARDVCGFKDIVATNGVEFEDTPNLVQIRVGEAFGVGGGCVGRGGGAVNSRFSRD